LTKNLSLPEDEHTERLIQPPTKAPKGKSAPGVKCGRIGIGLAQNPLMVQLDISNSDDNDA